MKNRLERNQITTRYGWMKCCAMLLALGALCAAVTVRAEDRVRYQARPGSSVSIAGTSTIHDWTMDGRIIGGFMEVPAGVEFDQSKAELAGAPGGKLDARVQVSIPVTSLKSGHDGMDEVMQQAMNAKVHPRIQYQLIEMTLKTPHAAGAPFEFDTKGDLIVNGVTNAITMPVKIESAGENKLKITGKTPLKMTDYKVQPPAPKIALGMIKTGDEVTITFEWNLAQPVKK